MTTSLFIEPLDVLFLRGNKLFGDPGSYGESLVPPWPSVAAGAIRTALLAHRGHDPARYGNGEVTGDAELGTPRNPGTFALTGFHVAQRMDDGSVESLYPLPADLVASEEGGLEVRRINPSRPNRGLANSSATALLAVLPESSRSKPESNCWLTRRQWTAHLRGEAINAGDLVRGRDLWQFDERVGVGLDPAKRRAADGQLFTTQAVALGKAEHRVAGRPRARTVGFVAEVCGATLPASLMLRFGGDGRAALATAIDGDHMPSPIDYGALARSRRCRLILTSPGLFAGGWKPTGTTTGAGDSLGFDLCGVRGRLNCAAVPRAEMISGFDLAKRQPKPAQRVAPAGSVYWLDQLDATADALRKLAERGLWSVPAENALRRAEGFNRFTFATY